MALNTINFPTSGGSHNFYYRVTGSNCNDSSVSFSSNSSTWLSVRKNGNGNTVVVSAQTNPNSTNRTGQIIVKYGTSTCANNRITVTQDKKEGCTEKQTTYQVIAGQSISVDGCSSSVSKNIRVKKTVEYNGGCEPTIAEISSSVTFDGLEPNCTGAIKTVTRQVNGVNVELKQSVCEDESICGGGGDDPSDMALTCKYSNGDVDHLWCDNLSDPKTIDATELAKITRQTYTSITLGECVEVISSDVSFPNSVKEIIVNENNTAYDSRNNCNAIIETSINTLLIGCDNTVIPNGIEYIDTQALKGCTGLTSVTFPNSLKEIGDSSFANCSSLAKISIPNSVIMVDSYAFSNCSSLTSITFPTNPEFNTILNSVFLNCSSLTNVTVPNNIIRIAENAFEGCSSLTSITYNSVVEIGDRAFFGCSNLRNVHIPASVTSVGAFAFKESDWWNNQGYGLIYLDNWLVDYKLENEDGYDPEIEIQNGTVGIASRVFYGKTITSFTIPNSVKYICLGAFADNSRLTSINIPDSVEIIEANAFSSCPYLQTITIGSGIKEIQYRAFGTRASSMEVTINATTPPNIVGEPFTNNDNLIIYVPAESVETYKSNHAWQNYATKIYPIQ